VKPAAQVASAKAKCEEENYAKSRKGIPEQTRKGRKRGQSRKRLILKLENSVMTKGCAHASSKEVFMPPKWLSREEEGNSKEKKVRRWPGKL